jgi:hypothetical protein
VEKLKDQIEEMGSEALVLESNVAHPEEVTKRPPAGERFVCSIKTWSISIMLSYSLGR